MKTRTSAVILSAAISIALAGAAAAAPPGKHAANDTIPHKHGAGNASASHVEHTMLKRVGPPGKGLPRASRSAAR